VLPTVLKSLPNILNIKISDDTNQNSKSTTCKQHLGRISPILQLKRLKPETYSPKIKILPLRHQVYTPSEDTFMHEAKRGSI
jgi:hypothetical protein